MRKLMIRFTSEGDYFREIDEERNYFLTEAEKIVNQIRNKLRKERREVRPKGFELWLDGRQLILTSVSFESKETLENQLVETMLATDSWEEETKHKYINLLKKHADLEKQYFVNKEFEAFAIRFDEVHGNESKQQAPLLFEIEKLKLLFEKISTHIEAGFYAEIESIMDTIKIAYDVVKEKQEKEIEAVKQSESVVPLEEKKSFLKVRLATWFGNEDNFTDFMNYVVARYGSVSEKGIRSLAARFPIYQDIQNKIYKEYTQKLGFENALNFDEKMIDALYAKYEEILFSGFTIESDDSLLSLVISPICNDYLIQLERVIDDLEKVEEVETMEESGEEDGTENRKETV